MDDYNNMLPSPSITQHSDSSDHTPVVSRGQTHTQDEVDAKDEVLDTNADSYSYPTNSSTQLSNSSDYQPVDRREQWPICDGKSSPSCRSKCHEHKPLRDRAMHGYTCVVCGRTYKLSSSLKQHMCSSHAGDKSYSCYECGMKFAYLSGLSVHIRSHSGTRPYSCSVCDREFTQIGSLKRHMLAHTGVKPHCCALCGGKFANAFNLKRHIVRAHNGPRGGSSEPLSTSVQHVTSIQLRNRLVQEMKLQMIQKHDPLHQSQDIASWHTPPLPPGNVYANPEKIWSIKSHCNALLQHIWNAPSLSIFCRELKTVLFRSSFPDVIWQCTVLYLHARRSVLIYHHVLAATNWFYWRWSCSCSAVR